MRRVAIGSHIPELGPLGSAARDIRPTVVGCRVRLLGKLSDGAEGIVTGIDLEGFGESSGRPMCRWVHFDGEAFPVVVPLSLLRRLP